MSIRMCPTRITATGIEGRPAGGVRLTSLRSTLAGMIRRGGTSMKLLSHHHTQAGRARPHRRYAVLIALAVAVAALAWLSFNALIRFTTLD
jgi:type VI protein secretion system component VasF